MHFSTLTLLPSFTNELKAKLLEYYIVGGMPKVVGSWVAESSIDRVEELQQEILDA